VQDIFRVQRRVHGIILISGIAKRKFLAEIRGACNVLVNDVAVKDRAPSWAAGLNSWAYDDIGTREVVTGSARPHDRYFDGGHSALVSVEHFRDFILPIVQGKGIKPGVKPGPEIPELHQSHVRTLRNVLLIATATGVVAVWLNWPKIVMACETLCLRIGFCS
jgi:hypothetical protein